MILSPEWLILDASIWWLSPTAHFAAMRLNENLIYMEAMGVDIRSVDITVAGFSRGGAEALSFLNVLSDSGRFTDNRVSALLYDPVASIWVPGDNSNPGLKLTMPDSLNNLRVVSIVSNWEHRYSFPSTHILLDDGNGILEGMRQSKDGRFTEILGEGVHSDVGGGYFDNDNLAKYNFLKSLNAFYGAELNSQMPLLDLNKMKGMELKGANFEGGLWDKTTKSMLKMNANANGSIDYKLHDSSALFLGGAGSVFRALRTMVTGNTGRDLRNHFYQAPQVQQPQLLMPLTSDDLQREI